MSILITPSTKGLMRSWLNEKDVNRCIPSTISDPLFDYDIKYDTLIQGGVTSGYGYRLY